MRRAAAQPVGFLGGELLGEVLVNVLTLPRRDAHLLERHAVCVLHEEVRSRSLRVRDLQVFNGGRVIPDKLVDGRIVRDASFANVQRRHRVRSARAIHLLDAAASALGNQRIVQTHVVAETVARGAEERRRKAQLPARHLVRLGTRRTEQQHHGGRHTSPHRHAHGLAAAVTCPPVSSAAETRVAERALSPLVSA